MPIKQIANPFFDGSGLRRDISGNDNNFKDLNIIHGRNVRLDLPRQIGATIDFSTTSIGPVFQSDFSTFVSPYKVLIDPATSYPDCYAEILKDYQGYARVLKLFAQKNMGRVEFRYKHLPSQNHLNFQTMAVWGAEVDMYQAKLLQLYDDLGRIGLESTDEEEMELHDFQWFGVSQMSDYRPFIDFVDPIANFPSGVSHDDAYIASRSQILCPVLGVLSTPPLSGMVEGDRYLVDPNPQAGSTWEGHANEVAEWQIVNNAGQWVFPDTVSNGQIVAKVYLIDTGASHILQYSGSAWVDTAHTYRGTVAQLPVSGRISDNPIQYPSTGDVIFVSDRKEYYIADLGWKLLSLPIEYISGVLDVHTGHLDEIPDNGLKYYFYDWYPTEDSTPFQYQIVKKINGVVTGTYPNSDTIYILFNAREGVNTTNNHIFYQKNDGSEWVDSGVYVKYIGQSAPGPIDGDLWYEDSVRRLYKYIQSVGGWQFLRYLEWEGSSPPALDTSGAVYYATGQLPSYGYGRNRFFPHLGQISIAGLPFPDNGDANTFIKNGSDCYHRQIWKPLWSKDYYYVFKNNLWMGLPPEQIGGVSIELYDSWDYLFHPWEIKYLLSQLWGSENFYRDDYEVRIKNLHPADGRYYKAGIRNTTTNICYRYFDDIGYETSEELTGEGLVENRWKSDLLFSNPYSWQPFHFQVKNFHAFSGIGFDFMRDEQIPQSPQAGDGYISQGDEFIEIIAETIEVPENPAVGDSYLVAALGYPTSPWYSQQGYIATFSEAGTWVFTNPIGKRIARLGSGLLQYKDDLGWHSLLDENGLSMSYMGSVLSVVTDLPQENQIAGDRYLKTGDNKIYEWNGGSWDEEFPGDSSAYVYDQATKRFWKWNTYQVNWQYAYESLATAPSLLDHWSMFFIGSGAGVVDQWQYNSPYWKHISPALSSRGTSYPGSPQFCQCHLNTDTNKIFEYVGDVWAQFKWRAVSANSTFPTTSQVSYFVSEYFDELQAKWQVLYRFYGTYWSPDQTLSYISGEEPSTPSNNEYWADTINLKVYQYVSGTGWVFYCDFQCYGFGQPYFTSNNGDPASGETFFNTADQCIYRYEQEYTWVRISPTVLARQATPPTPQVAGDLYLDTDDDLIYEWDGSQWQEFIFSVNDAKTEHPDHAGKYYNTTDSKIYGWNGSAWVEIVISGTDDYLKIESPEEYIRLSSESLWYQKTFWKNNRVYIYQNGAWAEFSPKLMMGAYIQEGAFHHSDVIFGTEFIPAIDQSFLNADSATLTLTKAWRQSVIYAKQFENLQMGYTVPPDENKADYVVGDRYIDQNSNKVYEVTVAGVQDFESVLVECNYIYIAIGTVMANELFYIQFVDRQVVDKRLLYCRSDSMGFAHGASENISELNGMLGTNMTVGNYFAGGEISVINPASWGRPLRIGAAYAEASETEDAVMYVAAFLMGGDPLNQTLNTVTAKSLGLYTETAVSFVNLNYMHFGTINYPLLQRGLISAMHMSNNERGFTGYLNYVLKGSEPVGPYPTLITDEESEYGLNHIVYATPTYWMDGTMVDIAPFIGMLIFDAQESRWKMYNGQEFVSTPQMGGTDKFFVPALNTVTAWDPTSELPTNPVPFSVYLAMGVGNGWVGGRLYMYIPQMNGYQDVEPTVGMTISEPNLQWTAVCRAVSEEANHTWEMTMVKYVRSYANTIPGDLAAGDRFIVHPDTTESAWENYKNGIVTWSGDSWIYLPSSSFGIGTAIYANDENRTYILSINQSQQYEWKNSLPDTVLGAMEYQGVHDCSTQAYPTQNLYGESPQKGDYWVCNVAGTINSDGKEYAIGDWLVYNGTSWDKIDNTQTNIVTQYIRDGETATSPSEDVVFDALANKQNFSAELEAIAGLSTVGYGVRTAASTWAARTIQGTVNRISITNEDGVAGNTIIDINTSLFPSPLAGDAGKVLKATGANAASWQSVSGTGDVIGPATTTENKVPQWDTNQKTLKDGLELETGTGAPSDLDTKIISSKMAKANLDAKVKKAVSSTDGRLSKWSGTSGDSIVDSSVSETDAADAVSKKHSQGSDSGTTQSSFQIDSSNSGPRIKNNTGVMEVRNAADSALAVVRGATCSGNTDLTPKLYVDDGLSGKEPTLTKGNLTASGPISLDQTRQVIGGDAVISIQDASVTQKGATQLSNSYVGTSQILATTEKALSDGLATKASSTHNHTGVYEPADSNIQDAVSKRHSQNTDSGTSSSSFQIGTDGPKWERSTQEIHAKDSSNNLTKVKASEVEVTTKVKLGPFEITYNAVDESLDFNYTS